MEKSSFLRFNYGAWYPIKDNGGKTIGQWCSDKLRSNVFEIMLEEVPNFCKLSMSWSSECHRQVCMLAQICSY